MKTIRELDLPRRVLMGPGPVDVDPRVRAAAGYHLLSHLDPHFLEIMQGVLAGLRELFRTNNEFAAPVPGTGHAGMEACLVSTLEPGDTVVICIHGLFAERMADIAGRIGAQVIRIEAEWGSPIDPAAVEQVLKDNPEVKLLSIVHGETSTGVLQPLEEISRLCKEHDVLLLVDTVSSLGGVDVRIDDWGVDIAYSGSQKCLSAPPGLAPVTMNQRVVEVIRARRRPVQSWYLDLSMILGYWGKERFYHHTAPINMIYALSEALRLYLQEGREQVLARHDLNGRALCAGAEALGLELPVPQEYRMPQLTVIRVPEQVDDAEFHRALLDRYGVEIGGGLGRFKGLVWRVGLMGYSSSRRNVLLLLTAMEELLRERGMAVPANAGIRAALEVYDAS